MTDHKTATDKQKRKSLYKNFKKLLNKIKNEGNQEYLKELIPTKPQNIRFGKPQRNF